MPAEGGPPSLRVSSRNLMSLDHRLPFSSAVLGRGNQHTKFPGNQRFYDTIDLHMPMYDVAARLFRALISDPVVPEGLTDSSWNRTCCYSLTSSGMIFLRKDKKTGIYHQINDMASRQKISHAIRYRRNLEETQTETSDRGGERATSSTANIMSSESVSDDDMESNACIAVVSDPGFDVSRVEPHADIVHTPMIDLFSDEDLDSVLPFQFRVDSSVEIVQSSTTALAVLQDWSIPFADESPLAKDSLLDATLAIFQDWSIPLVANELLLDSYQVVND
eukprot:scaffold4723_cov172-Amphora_coffeaeformis.AAC.14